VTATIRFTRGYVRMGSVSLFSATIVAFQDNVNPVFRSLASVQAEAPGAKSVSPITSTPLAGVTVNVYKMPNAQQKYATAKTTTVTDSSMKTSHVLATKKTQVAA
tara:strand:+ start:517 stop:831 length:315 start_codon:yes stop_codon:yes gene_type:complete